MQDADVAVLPSVDVGKQSAEQVLATGESLGWPLLVKASAGGGGRGMRIVRNPAEFAALPREPRAQESQAAFGDSTLFVEPYVETPRHVEVQIFGDTHGNVVHLFERECSIQRRHQKIIEESPSVAVDDELRRAMTDAALRLAARSAMSTRARSSSCSHPMAAFISWKSTRGCKSSIRSPSASLAWISCDCRFWSRPGQPLPAELDSTYDARPRDRSALYAEDPERDYLPSAGRLHRFRFADDADVRIESAVGETAVVSPYYDSLLAKVIAHAPTRAEAARKLSRALARSQIHGLRTNRELLVRTLEHSEFLEGKTDTHFLERHNAAALAAPLGGAESERWHAAAAALADQAHRRREAKVLRPAPSGWRNNPSEHQTARFQGRDGEIAIEYRFERGGLHLRIDGLEQPHTACEVESPERIRLSVDGISRAYDVQHVGAHVLCR